MGQNWGAAAVSRGYRFRGRVGAPSLPGVLFRAGDDIVADDVVDALDSETPFLAGSLRGRFAVDTSLPRQVTASFVALPLPREVPNLLLFGAGIGVLTLAGVAAGSRQRLDLEGDFGRTFTLYCPEGYERDALYLFAPDLMQLLVDATGGCDVELVDQWMFVYARAGRFADAAALDRIAQAAAVVGAKLQRQAGRYTDDRNPDARPVSAPASPAAPPRTVSPDEHAAARSAVAATGRRVRTRASTLQRLATVVSTLVVGGALVWWVVTDILPDL